MVGQFRQRGNEEMVRVRKIQTERKRSREGRREGQREGERRERTFPFLNRSIPYCDENRI